jgi:mono/diheme cytochrome c family protein
MHLIRLAEYFPDAPAIRKRIADLARSADPLVDLQLALSLGRLAPAGATPDYGLLVEVLNRYPGDTLLMEAALSGLAGQEGSFKDFLLANGSPVGSPSFLGRLDDVLARATAAPPTVPEPTFATPTDPRTRGMLLFGTHCATCHGSGGQGIANLAPPLAGSDYVAGPDDRLILLTLHGLSGPIHINGERYELNAVMPGVKENPELSDTDIAAILTFTKNAFSQRPTSIRPARVKDLRTATPAGYSFTEEELLQKVKELAPDREP